MKSTPQLLRNNFVPRQFMFSLPKFALARHLQLGVCSLLFSLHTGPVLAQTASIDFTADRDYVFQNGNDALLPIVIAINNPTFTQLLNVQFSITMPHGVNLGNVDNECVENTTGITRTLNCSVSRVTANSTKILDFFIDGPKSAVGPSFTLSLNSPTIPVNIPGTYVASLADGDTRIQGTSLTIQRVRNINFDGNQNKVPDIDEAIMKQPPGTPVADLLARAAVIDLLFIYSPAAVAYLDGKIGNRIMQYLTASNQIFKDNNIAIKFNLVGLAEVPYNSNDSSIAVTFNTLLTRTHPAFGNLGTMVKASGGDLVVFLHALSAGSGPACVNSSTNAIGRQGDFQQVYHQGSLITAMNVGPDCLGFRHLAAAFAANMGIVPTRADAVNGGTFHYSAGYGIVDRFTTLMARQGTQFFGSAQALNRFSNPETYCNSLICGVDRNSIAAGADAVNSLNRTRHVVSALSDTVFHAQPNEIPDKLTLLPDQGYDLDIVHAPVQSGAIVNEFTEFQVIISNNTGVTLHDLDISFRHLDNGSITTESQTYRNSTEFCTILGTNLGASGTVTNGVLQKNGFLTCFISSISPGQSLAFNYQVQIDTTPPVFNGKTYYHEFVSVNNLSQAESVACIPVYANFIAAIPGSTVCSEVQNPFGDPGQIAEVIDLNALPTITGSTISVPFIRLFDSSLISADFRINYLSEVQLQLLSYRTLDSDLMPTTESTYSEAGLLDIRSLALGAVIYNLQATLIPDSNPPSFGTLIAVQISP